MDNKSNHENNHHDRSPVSGRRERVSDLVSRAVRVLKRDYVIVGKQQIEVWRFGLLIGVVAGLTAGIVFVANRSGQFNLGLAVTDTTAPSISTWVGNSMAAPSPSITAVWKTVTLTANATDNVSITGVQFKLDGVNLGPEVLQPLQPSFPYFQTSWDTATANNGQHVLTAAARDAAGNTQTSAPVTVTVDNSDQTPPVISAVSALSITADSAFITWNTDEAGDSAIDYGPTTSYGNSASFGSALVKSHSFILQGLSSKTFYHYRIKSKDKFGNLATSGDFTFTTVAVPDLAGYWKFDPWPGTVDYSGNGNIASFLNGAAVTQETGVLNVPATKLKYSVNLDGANDYIDLKATELPAANKAQTIALWAKYGAAPAKTEHLISITNASANSGIYFGFKGGMLRAWKAGSNNNNLVSTAVPSVGAWHHYVYAFTGTTHTLYIDGAQKITSTVAPNTALPNDADIGRNTANLTQNFTGRIDDVRMYNRALSAAEISQLYAAMNDSTAPSQVTLTATAVSGSQINLSWSAATDNLGVALYSIQRTRGAASEFVASVPPAITSYQDTGLISTTEYKYQITAFDAVDNQKSSAQVSATTKPAPDTTAPTVSITAPTNGATVSATTTISAIAYDNVSVVGVQFRVDGENLGEEDTESPYSVFWNIIGAASGAHALTAVARDTFGNRGESTPVNITVVPPPMLTLVKVVVNNHGGTKQLSDFVLKIDGAPVMSGVPTTLTAGSHTASETNLIGYAASAWGGDCALNGAITLANGDNKICTITNDDIPLVPAPDVPLHSRVSIEISLGSVRYTCKSVKIVGNSWVPYDCGSYDLQYFSGITISEPIWINGAWYVYGRFPYLHGWIAALNECDTSIQGSGPVWVDNRLKAVRDPPLDGKLVDHCTVVTWDTLYYWLKVGSPTSDQSLPRITALLPPSSPSQYTVNKGFYPAPDATGALPEGAIDGTKIADTDIPEPDPSGFDSYTDAFHPDAIMGVEKGKFSASQVQSFKDAVADMRAKTGGMWDGINIRVVGDGTFNKMVSSYITDMVKEVFGLSGPEVDKAAAESADQALAVFIRDPYSGAVYINGDKLNSAWLSQNGGGLVDNTLSGALLHEVGHAAGFNTLAGNTMDWCNLSTGGGLGACTLGNNKQVIANAKPLTSVSQYGTNSVNEDFAETYVSYFATGGSAASLNPPAGSLMTPEAYRGAIQAKFNYMQKMGVFAVPPPPR